jgi:WD40 repeat protein
VDRAGHSGAVTGLVFAKDGEVLVSSDDVGTVIIWIREEKGSRAVKKHVLDGHDGCAVLSIAALDEVRGRCTRFLLNRSM